MTSNELRQKFLKFFESKGHTIIPSASLVPENDPSVLFTTAGMHPLVPYLLGENHPGGKKVANVQKCIRTGDIDEVGDAIHHTFFEMLGNWSFGDYFKEEAIKMSWEFLTSEKWLGLDKNRIAISVFKGDSDAPFDEESYSTWKSLGISEKRIAKLPKENNWWGMEKGPCGPDTEMFYWVGDPNEVPESFNDGNNLWVEIWNDVFMEYNKIHDNEYETLKQKNVDTGMGMERMLACINGFDDDYKTELFWPVIQKIEEISKLEYGDKSDGEYIKDNKKCWVDTRKSFRIIADHLRSSVMIIGDEKGIVPSNVGQGYIVRRLIRRAVRHGKILGIENNFTKEIAEVIIGIYKDTYKDLGSNKEKIFEELEKEENKFRKTLSGGLARFDKFISNPEGNYVIRKVGDQIQKADLYINDETADMIFDLYQTYGFPLDLVFEELGGKEINFDKTKLENKFKERLQKHQELSRTASAGMFKGGLADASEETKKLHTAAHLLLAALRKVFGSHVVQKGSNITSERLRFDFSHPEKMTDEQKQKVEKLVNEVIQKDFPVECAEMGLDEAKKQGAMGVFENKYGEKVKVYSIGDVSKEICGGPHVTQTGNLGKFKIVKEESSSAGIRRIKAILE
jgi:alanyl-tRNA synthetase